MFTFTLIPLHCTTQTEDEALSLAIAASLQDSEPAENLSMNRNSSKRPEQRYPCYAYSKASCFINSHLHVYIYVRLEEDEALARAIAASLNDQSTNRSQTDSKVHVIALFNMYTLYEHTKISFSQSKVVLS